MEVRSPFKDLKLSLFGPVLELLSNVGISAINCLYTPAYIIGPEVSIYMH